MYLWSQRARRLRETLFFLLEASPAGTLGFLGFTTGQPTPWVDTPLSQRRNCSLHEHVPPAQEQVGSYPTQALFEHLAVLEVYLGSTSNSNFDN